jgi:hypothetical protein
MIVAAVFATIARFVAIRSSQIDSGFTNSARDTPPIPAIAI